MAIWSKFALTNGGKTLLAKHVANEKPFIITRVATTNTTDTLDIKNLAKLPGDERFFGIMSNTLTNDEEIKVECMITNVGLAEPYKLTAIGLYAKLNDDETDTLFAVTTATDPDTIPDLNNGVVKLYTEKIFLAFDSTEDVSVKIDMDTYVTHSECIETAYPVGTVVQTDGSYRPADKWGGVWEQISGVYLMASGVYNGTTCRVNNYAGEYAHRQTYDEMFPHGHTRGTMNITGSFWGRDVQSGYNGDGAFYIKKRGNWNDEGGHYHDEYPSVMGFDAARSWTGVSSTEGGGKPWPVMPRAYVVDVWRRVK